MKKGQQKLFLEKIDGTTTFEGFEGKSLTECYMDDEPMTGSYLMCHTLGAYKAAYQCVDFRFDSDGAYLTCVDSNKLLRYFIENKIHPEFQRILTESLMNDSFARNAGMAYLGYLDDENSKNYVLSGNLTKCMGNINMNIPVDYLPKKFSAYMEPTNLYDDDGLKVLGAFVCIGEFSGLNEAISITFFTSSSIKQNSNIRLTKGFIELNSLLGDLRGIETLDELKYSDADESTPFYQKVENNKMSSSRIFRTLVNTVLYIAGGNEKFEEEVNTFAKNIKKYETQKKIYSQKRFVKLGYQNAEHLKLIVDKEIKVREHFRNQAYGPKRSLRKTILIGEQERTIKKKVKTDDKKIQRRNLQEKV